MSDQALVAAAPDPAPAPPPIEEPAWVTKAADERGWAWVRQNWRRAATVHGSWYDTAKADAIVAAFPRWFTLTILHFAGVEFKLAFWQECIVRLLFGWKIETEVLDPRTHEKKIIFVRLFRELRLWVPRKAGKSEFLSALALIIWYYEGLSGGEGYCFARDENQARIPFDRMKKMLGGSDDLRTNVRAYADLLWCQRNLAPFHLITSKAEGKHGRVPYVTLGDEMHEWRSRDLADNLRQGEGPHLQPLRLYASTAGLKSQLVGREMFEESEKLLDGRMDDPTVCVAIFAAADEDDWRDEAIWAKANPNLGLSPTLTYLRQEYAKTRTSAAAEAKFRCYHLNQWVENYQRWIRLSYWDKCGGDPDGWRKWSEEIEQGRECVLTFDSTEVSDFGVLHWRFPPQAAGEKTKMFWKFFLPSETIEARGEAEGNPQDYERWIKHNLLISIPGGVFELPHAIKLVRETAKRWKIKKIGYDPWNAGAFYTELVNPTTAAPALAEDLFQKMRFGHQTLGEATRDFEREVKAGDIEHGGDPIVRWMMSHCHVRYDVNMNIVPAKKKSEKPIDGIVAAVMAKALLMEKAEPPSFWQRGKQG